jgi:nickel superoxide dismutase
MKTTLPRFTPRVLAVAILGALAAGYAFAHCEIPCGIYGDRTRMELLLEHTVTIEKSMTEINRLAGAHAALDFNQATRWVENKEDHASEVQHLVTQYFMTQRVKPIADGADGRDRYLTQLTSLHEALIAAMKCKQTVDVKNVEALRGSLTRFSESYFTPEDLAHMKEHHGG